MPTQYTLYQEIVQMPNKDIGINGFYYDCVHSPSAGVFPLHWHECLEIISVESGWIEVEIDRKRYRIQSGQIAVINPRQLHSCDRFDPDATLRCLIIDMDVFRSRFVDSSEERFILPLLEGRVLLAEQIDGSNGLQSLIHSCVDSFDRRDIAYQLHLKALIFELLYQLFAFHCAMREAEQRNLPTSVSRERVNAVLEYVDTHYAERIQLNDLVEIVHINKYYICKIFQQYTGKTVFNYVNEVRIRKAEELLLTTNRTVTDIAYATGFLDINYFSRIFKQIMGITPTELRKKYLKV